MDTVKTTTKFSHPILGERSETELKNFFRSDKWQERALNMGFVPNVTFHFTEQQKLILDRLKVFHINAQKLFRSDVNKDELLKLLSFLTSHSRTYSEEWFGYDERKFLAEWLLNDATDTEYTEVAQLFFKDGDEECYILVRGPISESSQTQLQVWIKSLTKHYSGLKLRQAIEDLVTDIGFFILNSRVSRSCD